MSLNVGKEVAALQRMPMSSELPFVSCLCPTYRRPKLLKNSIACFEAQDYPADRRELIVLDDAGELQNQTGDGWQIISIIRRFRSLPEKFNALAGLSHGEILVVWEDDDICLPHHISSHVAAMQGHLWSKPSKVLMITLAKCRRKTPLAGFTPASRLPAKPLNKSPAGR